MKEVGLTNAGGEYAVASVLYWIDVEELQKRCDEVHIIVLVHAMKAWYYWPVRWIVHRALGHYYDVERFKLDAELELAKQVPAKAVEYGA